jgi:hypothetical protein
MRRMLLMTVVILGSLAGAALAGTRDSLWKQVDEAIRQGLPKTAAGVLDQIIPNALQDQAYAEACKAICLKIVYESQVAGSGAEQRIVQLQAQIGTVPEQARPCLEAILGHWYWLYFQQNRWRFLQRTTTAEPPGEDITTWDLAAILAETGRHFTAALAQDALLKATPIAQFSDLLDPGTVPDIYRPTLYDFLAFDALSFYSAGEQAGARPQDAYDLTADGPIFGPTEDFLQWHPQTTDTQSATLKAVGLYQALLVFHQADADKAAFLDADLHRLEFGYSRAVGPDKVDRYIAALDRFVDQWIDHEIAARALLDWAQVLNAQGDPLQAHQVAQRGWKAFPKSYGGLACYNLIQQIEAKSPRSRPKGYGMSPCPRSRSRTATSRGSSSEQWRMTSRHTAGPPAG